MTKIQLSGELNGFLNLKEDTTCPITFSVSDIKDVTKKKGAFSKSITLVGDKNNNKLLGNIFDINVSQGTFNINKVVECNILQNEIPILENGIFQLVSINKIQNDKYEDEITYTCLVKDNIGDFFTQINNKELTDLTGFEWMKHIYTADKVIESFNNTIVDGYKYIMPYTPEGQDILNDATLDLTEFSPGIYTKIYFDKIFQQAGYSYKWDGMDDEHTNFSKLIIPFNGEKPVVNGVEDLNYTAVVKSTSTQDISTRTQNVNSAISNRVEITQSTSDRILMPSELSDIGNRWNSLGSFYTPPNLPSNQNSIEIEYEVSWELITNSLGTAYLKNYNTSSSFDFIVTPQIKIRRSGSSQYLSSTSITNNGDQFRFKDGKFIPNGNTVQHTGSTTFKQTAPGIDPNYNIEVSANVYTSGGWMFKATNNIGGSNRTSTNFRLRITSIKAKIKTIVEGVYGYNIPIDMKRYVPQKVKQSDFIKSILTMYNLYVDVDKDNPKQLNLISRDKYYDDGAIKDWTKKQVKNKPQEVRFIPEVASKSIILTYKEDSDISNKIYKEASGEIYGQQKFTFDNEFVKEEKKQEITFSPTPIFNTSFGAICPMWLGGSPKCNLRILYDGGEYNCNTYNIVNYRLNSGAINQVSTNKYPYISHWNKPTNPTFDLNFGVCDYYFRSDDFGSLTNNNLFNLHWRRTFNQINTGKIMTCEFILNETDISNLKLNDKIRIDNSWWNINKVQDYDGNSNKSTKVELISIDDNLLIPFQTRRIRVIKDLSSDLIATPIRTISKERDKFLTVNLSPYDIEVRGKYNYIVNDVTSATIIGDGNLISANSQVYGNDNIISAESTVIGSNNIIEEDAVGSVVNGNETVVVTTSEGTFVDLISDQTITGMKTFDDGILIGTTYSSFNTTLNSDPLTSDRIISFPDQSGTIALTSDIAGLSPNVRVTRLQAETLESTNGFVVGVSYTITDADVGLYGGTEVTLLAIEQNKLSLQGSGKFYCPKYDLVIEFDGTWTKYMEGTFGTITGTFTNNETVTANNGATAKFLTIGFLEWISGNWSGATSITGGTSGATCTVSGFVSPSYTIGQVVHWGGKSWTNVNGNVGNSTDEFTMNSEWSEISFNDVDYNIFIDEIHYDFERDRIIYRKDKYGNVVSVLRDNSTISINMFKWGCAYEPYTGTFNGIYNNIMIESIINCINSINNDINYNNLFLSEIHTNNSVITRNNLEGSGIYNNINCNIHNNVFKYGSIGTNRRCSINSNTISNSYNIIDNTNMDITNNTIFNGDIFSNSGEIINNRSNTSVNGKISYNIINCKYNSYNNIINNIFNSVSTQSPASIENNVLFGKCVIYDNILSSSVINFGSISGSIYGNTLNSNSSIYGNTLNGSSSDNSSSIYSNTLNSDSHIYGNTLNGSSNNYSRIYGNTLNSYSRIYGNTLNSDSHIYGNTLNSYSRIYGNTLNSNSHIYGNTLNSYSNIYNNTLNSNIQSNTLNNSQFIFSNISTNIQNCQVNAFNPSHTTISLSGATIIGSVYSKNLFSRQDGGSLLSYVNNSNVQIITNVNA